MYVCMYVCIHIYIYIHVYIYIYMHARKHARTSIPKASEELRKGCNKLLLIIYFFVPLVRLHGWNLGLGRTKTC